MSDNDKKETQLTDLGKTLFVEVMDEIDEEINDGLGGLIAEEKIEALSGTLKKSVEEKVVKLISKYVKDDMTEVEKMILGEKLARVVTKNAKKDLAELLSEIIEKTYEVMYELRNEIVEEVFEETEEEDETEEISV